MNHNRDGVITIHCSVFIFGVTALFSKLITLSALEITLLSSLFAAIAIAVFIYWQKEYLRLNKTRDYKIVILLGILLAVHWVSYFHAMQVSSIAIGVIALYTFPIITVFLEPLFKAERPHIHDIFSAIAVLFGVYLLVQEFSISNNITQGVLWGAFSAFCFALRNVIQGHYFTGQSARHSLFYQSFVTLIVLLPFSFTVIPDVSPTQIAFRKQVHRCIICELQIME